MRVQFVTRNPGKIRVSLVSIIMRLERRLVLVRVVSKAWQGAKRFESQVSQVILRYT